MWCGRRANWKFVIFSPFGSHISFRFFLRVSFIFAVVPFYSSTLPRARDPEKNTIAICSRFFLLDFSTCEWADARVRGSIKIKTNVVRIDVRVAGIFAWHFACLSPTCAWLSSHEFFKSAYNARIRKLFLFCSRIIIIYKNASHAYRRLPSSPQHRSATFTTYCSWSEVMESLVCPFLCHVLCQSIRSARDLDSQWYHASLTSTTSLSSIVMSTHHVMLDSGSSKNMNYCYLAESSVYFEWKSMKSLRSISVWICWIWNRIIKANVPNKENCIKSSKLTKFIIVCMREVSITWFLCLSIPGLLLPIPTTAFDHDCADAVVVARSRCECFVFYCYDYYCSFENYISSFYIVCGAILLGYSSCAMERESENFLAHFESMAVGCWFWADGCSALKRTICLAVTHKDSSVDIQWLPTIFATSTKLVDHFHSIWCRRIGDQRSTTVSARHLFMQKFANDVDVELPHVRRVSIYYFWLASQLDECSRIRIPF